MNFLNLQYFLLVAEMLNISKAAECLYISQQSLSAHIIKLEKILGTKLFNRKPQFTLTYAGTRLVDLASQILNLKQQIITEIDDINKFRRGKLTIGVSHTRGSAILPEILPEFKKANPLVEIALVEGNSQELEGALENGIVDLIIGFAPILLDSINTVEVAQEKLFAVVPHKYTKQTFGDKSEFMRGKFSESIDISAYIKCPFILLNKGNRIRNIIDDYFAKSNLKPNIILESDNIETTLALATKGMGITVYPELFLKNIHPYISENNLLKVDFFPFNKLLTVGTLVIGYSNNRYLSNAAQNFIDIALEVLQH